MLHAGCTYIWFRQILLGQVFYLCLFGVFGYERNHLLSVVKTVRNIIRKSALQKNINKNFWAKDPYVVVYNWRLQILEMSMCWMLIFFFTSEHQPFHIIFFSPRIYGCIYLTQRLYVSVILCNCGMPYIKRFPYIKSWIPMSLQWDNFLALSGTTWPCGASWTRSSGDK